MSEKDFETGQYFLAEESIRFYFEKCLSGENGISWDVFILINRKGYWDYKIFFPNGYPKKEGQIIISDRYLDKCPREQLQKLLSGKRIVVYDDSLTNGGNLFSYYLLCKRAGAKEVTPVVYALNVNFPTRRSYLLMQQELEASRKDVRFDVKFDNCIQEDFTKQIHAQLLLGARDIDRMSKKQTILFQKYESPLVMDLPILNHVVGEDACRITLTKEAFEKLRGQKGRNWEFVDNKMYESGQVIVASYFQYKEEKIERSLGNLFHDFVVKCKYNEENEKVQVVFTPFAIVKSCHLRKVFQNFKLFYKNTAYGKELLKGFHDEQYDEAILINDVNLCKALFRAVIFRLSDYVGRKFQQYVKELLQVELEYDWKIMEDNFDHIFIETQKEFYRKYDEKEFEELIYGYFDNEKIQPVNQREDEAYDCRIEATQERVDIYIRQRICDIKHNCINGTTALERMYTLETMEEELKERYIFKDEQQVRRMITTNILLFLETNSFSNCLYVEKESGIIYRGFRYGENSDIFLHENLWYFYAYLYAYYVECKFENLKKHYNRFMDWFESYLRESKAFDCWISRDGFKALKEYFGKLEEEELEDEIMRRTYLLNHREFGKENASRAEQIRKAAIMVKQSGRA